MKVAVINESASAYNLAAHRILTAQKKGGNEVWFSPRADMWALQCAKAYISVIFTWDLPNTIQDINLLTSAGVDVEVGGPAATALASLIEEQTPIKPHLGLDARFEHVEGKFYATFTSRGCPMGCSFCIVQMIEGKKVIEYDNFTIPVGNNPKVCDNNIITTSWAHQQMVVEKLKHVKNIDLNSGFDCRFFAQDPEKYYELYSKLKMERWRFAYDSPNQRKPLKVCVDYLHSKGIKYHLITVFCLVGGQGQSFDEAQERLQYLVDIGVTPYPQRWRPLNALTRNYDPPGWEPKMLEKLFQYYGVPTKWRTCKWKNFRPEDWK